MNMEKRVVPDYQPNSGGRAQLFATTVTPGFDVLQNIMGSVCLTFQHNMLLSDPGTPDATQKHFLSKAAAMFYETVISRVNSELMQYTHAPRDSDPIVDVTEGVIDLGEVAGLDDLPNLLGDVTLEEEPNGRG